MSLIKHKPWPIGLDIAPEGIRMLQLQPGHTRLSVLAGAQWRPGLDSGADELDDALATQAVREILDAGGFVGHHAVTSIGCDEIRIKTLRLPEMGREELYTTAAAQANELFDFDLSTASLSILRAGPVVQGDQPFQEMIILAVPNYALRHRRELVTEMGLAPQAVETEPLALFKAFSQSRRRGSDGREIHALIKLRRSSCLVIVAQGAEILFIRNIPRGGDNLSRSAAKQLGLSFQDARRLRQQIMVEYAARARNTDLPHPSGTGGSAMDSLLWEVYDAVREEAEALVLEIGLCLRYCINTFGCPRIEKATLAGEEAFSPSVIYLLAERLALRCDCADPLLGMEASRCPIFADRRGALADWLTCMGLARRRQGEADEIVKNRPHRRWARPWRNSEPVRKGEPW